MTDTFPEERPALAFENDAGSSRSRMVAGGLALAIVGWMGSVYVLPSDSPETAATGPTVRKAVTVAVRASAAQAVSQVFVAEGQALPDRDTMILAETLGQIAEVLVTKGADLEAGKVIARIDTAGRGAELTRVEDELLRAQREFDNAEALLSRGISTADRVAEASAALAAARAGVRAAEETIGDTEIRAPFAGRLEALDVEPGEFVSLGGEIGRIVDTAPLTIRIQIPQQSLADIEVGQTAEVAFISSATGTGTVRFVGTSADTDTRTFTAEIEVPNEGGRIPAGISAQLRIPTGEARAHFVSPAILSLGTDGTLGIKTVGKDDVVVFHAVDIVRAQTDGVWVSGLPDEARIISIGQGFVNDGDTVDPKADDGDMPDRAPEFAADAAQPELPSLADGQTLTVGQGAEGSAAPAVGDAAQAEEAR